MSVSPNLCCDETKNREAHARLTSTVPRLGSNLAETTSTPKRPSAGAQLSESPAVEADREENPGQGKARLAENWGSEKRTQQKAHAAQIPEDLHLRQEVLAPMAGGTCLTKS